jgi:hypothetical protein
MSEVKDRQPEAGPDDPQSQDVLRSESGFSRYAPSPEPAEVKRAAPVVAAPPKNELENLFESFMVNLVGKRGENDPTHWVSGANAGVRINFADDKKFLATWETGVAPTYRSSINEAMDYANAIVGPWRKINLLEQIRKHRPYFQVLVHTKWVQAQRTAKDGNWPHRNVLLQEDKNLKAVDKYYCAQAKL